MPQRGYGHIWKTQTSIEVLNVKVGVKKAIILLLYSMVLEYHSHIKVLKDALAYGPYRTLMWL
jgi:hypothetical protein